MIHWVDIGVIGQLRFVQNFQHAILAQNIHHIVGDNQQIVLVRIGFQKGLHIFVGSDFLIVYNNTCFLSKLINHLAGYKVSAPGHQRDLLGSLFISPGDEVYRCPGGNHQYS